MKYHVPFIAVSLLVISCGASAMSIGYQEISHKTEAHSAKPVVTELTTRGSAQFIQGVKSSLSSALNSNSGTALKQSVKIKPSLWWWLLLS